MPIIFLISSTERISGSFLPGRGPSSRLAGSFSTIPSLVNKGVLKKEKDSDGWPSFTRYYTYLLLNDESDISILREQLPKAAETVIPAEKIDRFGFDVHINRSPIR